MNTADVTERIAEASRRFKARIAGVFYFTIAWRAMVAVPPPRWSEKMKSLRIALSVVSLLLTTAAFAQSDDAQKSSEKLKNPDNPLSAFNKDVYAGVKGILLRSADKMPEESYNFKPTDAVRSYGQIIGHVADAQYIFCSIVLGEKNPSPKIEQTKTWKADLIAALKDAFVYCDEAYDGMTDASATQMVTLFGSDTPRLGVLSANNIAHFGTPRQPRHLHADEEHRSSNQRAGVHATAKEIMCLWAVHWSAQTSLSIRYKRMSA